MRNFIRAAFCYVIHIYSIYSQWHPDKPRHNHLIAFTHDVGPEHIWPEDVPLNNSSLLVAVI